MHVTPSGGASGGASARASIEASRVASSGPAGGMVGARASIGTARGAGWRWWRRYELRRELACDVGAPDRAAVGDMGRDPRIEAGDEPHDVLEVAEEEELGPRAVHGGDDLREVDD